MDYSPTLCFAGFNPKMIKFQQERREKKAISVVSIATEFYVSQQTSKQMAKEICHSVVATQRTEYIREIM